MKIALSFLAVVTAIGLDLNAASSSHPPVLSTDMLSRGEVAENILLRPLEPTVSVPVSSNLQSRFPLPFKVMPQHKERLDSIITLVNSTGEPYMATFYHYDGSNLPKLQDNCYWNAQTSEWDIAEQYGYEWNDDAFCLLQWQINYMYNNGLKYEYKYNADNLGISRTEYTYANDEWVPSTQNLYEYDDNGFVVQEILKFYDQSDGTWLNYLLHKVKCDEFGRNIHWEGYNWNGTDWVPYTEKQDITYDEEGHPIQVIFYKWMKDDSEWVNYYKVDTVYDDGLVIMQEHAFWNRELSSWVGRDDFGTGYPCTNLKSIFEYDSKRRLTSETVYQGLSVDGYTKSVVEECVYTTLEEGGTEMQSDTYYYELDEVTRESRNKRIMRYNAADSLTYSFQTILQNGEWINRSEEVRTYNLNNLISSSKSYTFSYTPENKKYAGISIDYFYDDNNNLKEKYYMMGLGTSEDDWYYTTHYEYNYELGDFQVDELCSKWDGSEFVPRNGDGWRYDYDTPVSDLILWVGPIPKYKILERRVYVNNNGEWDYYCYHHHYSNQEMTSIATNDKERDCILDVNADGSLLSVKSTEAILTSVYSSNGTLVMSSHSSLIDLSDLPHGLYIAHANGVTIKFIRK